MADISRYSIELLPLGFPEISILTFLIKLKITKLEKKLKHNCKIIVGGFLSFLSETF